MNRLLNFIQTAFPTVALLLLIPVLATSSKAQGAEKVFVSGRSLLLDGRPWIPHGYYQIAFEVAPANFSRADHPFWAVAYNQYTPEEYRFMHEAGADSVRIQIAQSAADPLSHIFDREFLEKALAAVHDARKAGLIVIISVQDESHVPGERPIDLPDDGTRRVWAEIAPRFAEDRGVLFELLNEPRPQPSPANWQRWQMAMNDTARSIRALGAHNVLVADGLAVGQVLDGAPLLEDTQVVYASHPYALKAHGQTADAWNQKFGNFSRRAPVLISEWLSGGYYCDTNTPQTTVNFLLYLQEHSIGLEAGIWDWAPAGFGSARWNFPDGKNSTFDSLACHQAGYGMGKTVESWYRNGVPPTSPQ